MTARPVARAGGVEVRAEGWGWRHAGHQRWAVRDIDLHIRAGERVLLLGASGSGKSTLLHGLAGLLGGHDEGEQAGRLLVDGAPPAAGRARVGMVLQDPDSQVILSRVGDDVAFGLENLTVPREEIWPRVERALRSVGLNLPLAQDTSVLSGGQKQRLALAGVLAMSPGLIILDEPTANLDADGVVEVRDAVRAVADETGATVIVVEHRTQVWLPVVDRVVVLDSDDGVLADGTPDEVLHRQREHLIDAGIWIPAAPTPRITRNRLPAEDPLLVADALAVGYRTPVRTGLDFTVTPGRITAVTGPNGAGKSTLALTLGGLIPAQAGRLQAAAAFAPSPRRREPVRWRSRELLTRIASVFQDPEHQFLCGTVLDEISLGLRALKRDARTIRAAVDPVLDRLRLAHLADRSPYTLSGGEKRRLSVATVLVTEPSVVVLDEPTFGQDRRTWTEMLHLLAELADHGTAVVTVTHDDEFVDLLADDRIRL
ncbi:ATPase component of various ABC transporters with duplicated ATPase domain [Mycolicibacterium phlei]|jgi:energy-coupling factor transporter ATP-binding protein EcfA2|uniref:ABC transporter ATP-binding protein n=1 Tax=Mycolicibacterium phlei DSM 43239 = CCUG 21000 TaxID=1226750 RepID=A0A5N5VDB5_MYCPH|nr:ABC transporter ATP-binding protein [Mycolicibacterium phlei]VEG11461.1 ATPase component of various ABC transporters with duplicated ATPase domain [Mycobacteroides chelonae]AMO63366.1 Putative HMP/thiamine import ATP-binding protein YkoD [Mycolicibacterium phlei]EID16013.1 ATPase component of various ABC transporters with duplicated ATPase domain [Mycolicibacterium phlei RIVM601174]KAB7759778.1 ABC transporter ATP-binding protein [Mycolicibacterium phlei DSM 43239 = CCUG 21000]KXW64139.1 AB